MALPQTNNGIDITIIWNIWMFSLLIGNSDYI